jgi:triacylglycerol lipase
MNAPKLRAPIVLVHGLLGFDHLKLCGWTVANYFANIPEFLQAAGNRVLTAQMSPTGGIAKRACQLKAFIEKKSSGEPVHLVAHSLGGLDSRHMISRLGGANHVLSLTTLGTPHRGTVFADWGLRRFALVLRPIFDLLGVPGQAFYDLSTANCRAFNEQTPDAPTVRYFSVAGEHEKSWLSPHWHVPHQMVSKAEGPNDGIVSVTSASYGESVSVWDGDHLSLINCRNPLEFGRVPERTAQYGALVRRLADEGF